jgi:hypothetical protein
MEQYIIWIFYPLHDIALGRQSTRPLALLVVLLLLRTFRVLHAHRVRCLGTLLSLHYRLLLRSAAI